jgi:hypothetical protein
MCNFHATIMGQSAEERRENRYRKKEEMMMMTAYGVVYSSKAPVVRDKSGRVPTYGPPICVLDQDWSLLRNQYNQNLYKALRGSVRRSSTMRF